jgi:acetoacetate decarboxylase
MNQDLKSLLSKLLVDQPSWKIKLVQEWHTIIGTLSGKVILEKIDNTTAILGVTHPAWIQEFSTLKPLMLKTINDHLGHPYITELRFKTVSPKKPKVIAAAPAQIKKKEHILSVRESNALETIKDPELKKALANFLQRCAKP